MHARDLSALKETGTRLRRIRHNQRHCDRDDPKTHDSLLVLSIGRVWRSLNVVGARHIPYSSYQLSLGVSMMDTVLFASELNARILQHDLLCHSFYKAWSAGQLTRDDLRQYACDYYHHVAAFPTYLSALHSRLPDGEARRAVARNLRDEEIDGVAHSDMWLDFAEGYGASRDEINEPIAEIRELIENFRCIAREGSTAEALAAFYAYESQVPRVAKEKARGLSEMYGADAKTRSYFTVHTYADVEHSQVWLDLLNRELERDPSQREAALNAADQAAQWLWHALDGIEARRTAVAA